MVITSENITHTQEIGHQIADFLSTFWVENMTITSSDNKKSIERKISLLMSLKDNLIANIDVNTLPSRAQRLNFIKLIAQITEQIQEFEIVIGKYSRQDLNRIGKNFGRKHQEPLSLTN